MAFSSSSSVLRKICVLGKWTAGSCPRGVRTATKASEAVIGDVQNPAAASSPWLMLPPRYEGRTTIYKFYSLAKDRVLAPFRSPIPNRRLTCRGSSRGWLALLSPRNLDSFLYNPISGRHIKLPSILTLPFTPDPDDDLKPDMSRRAIKKLILSDSPEEENCRAVIANSWTNELAFCCPGRSKEWTPLWDDGKLGGGRSFDDIVYSARRKLLFGLTRSGVLETWDLQDPSSPRLTEKVDMDIRQYYDYPSASRYSVAAVPHLVVVGGGDKDDDDLLFVIQYDICYVSPDGSCVDHFDYERRDNLTYLTIGFDVYKYDPKKGDLKSYSLDGLALFLGRHSDSVAFPAAQFPELKPNSIYFTDSSSTGTLEGDCDCDKLDLTGGHDIGIFNCQDKTVSPCYYPCDVPSLKRIFPAPMWYFPSRSI